MVYVSPPQPPSPVPEGSEEGSSPKGPSTDNGNPSGPEFASVGVFFHLLLLVLLLLLLFPVSSHWSGVGLMLLVFSIYSLAM